MGMQGRIGVAFTAHFVLYPQLKRGDRRDNTGNVRFGHDLCQVGRHFDGRLVGHWRIIFRDGKGYAARVKDQCKTIQQVCRLRCR